MHIAYRVFLTKKCMCRKNINLYIFIEYSSIDVYMYVYIGYSPLLLQILDIYVGVFVYSTLTVFIVSLHQESSWSLNVI